VDLLLVRLREWPIAATQHARPDGGSYGRIFLSGSSASTHVVHH
jgi:hypothetical protein